MKALPVPKDGLRLSGLPPNAPNNGTLPRAVYVELPAELVKTIARVANNGKQEIQLSLAKNPTLYVKKSPVAPTEFVKISSAALYKSSTETKNDIQLCGSLEYKFRVEKTKGEGSAAENDEALIALKNSLLLAAQQKQSKTSVFIKDVRPLPAPGRNQAALKSKALSMLRADARGGRTAMTQSMPVSPAIGAISPHIGPSDKSSLKMEALKKAAIHLLAVRPVSERYITSTLRCTSGELAPLLQKYGRPSRLDPAKLDLSDRGYKELDVWLFKYGAEDDRQSAIAHAIKAFDRMRISREERIWQMLLPKSKRGKGIILSKLQLHGGPIERVKTPRIHVQPTDESNNGGYSTGNESDRMRGRLAPSDAENMARSRSQDSIKKSKVSQKEAQSKRLLSKKPAKATPAAKPKVERPVAKPTPKAAAKKDAGAFGRKVKSAEFVENSDEDVEMVDAPPVGASSQKARPAVRAVKAAAKDLKIAKAVKAATRPIRATTQLFKPLPMPAKDPIDAKSTSKDPKAFETDAKLPPKESKSTAADPVKKSLPSQSSKEGKGKDAKHLASSNPLHVETRTRNVSKMSPLSSSSSGTNSRPSDGSQASVPMGRTVSHKRTTSSPVKPSPLGSSPPTNASDLEKEQDASKHSCSASPAKTGQKDQGASARKSIPRPTNAFDGDSDTSLKRKANDVDSDIHRHETSVPPDHGRKFKRQQTTSPSESDLSMTVPELTELDLLSRAFYDETLLYHKAHKRLSKKEATLGHEDVDEIKGLQASAQRLRNMQLKIYELAQQQQPGNGWTPPPLESEEIVDMDVSGMSVDALMEGVDMNRTLGEGHA